MPPGHQGAPTPSAYHSSPTQAYHHQHHHSPNTPAPLALQPHQHHRPPPSPTSTELPPISTALYARDTSRYYDPTSDNGDRRVARDPARYDPQYPPQVRPRPASIILHRVNSPLPCPAFSPPCSLLPSPFSLLLVLRDAPPLTLTTLQPRDPHAYHDARPAHSPYEKVYHSPVAAAYAPHHSPLQRPHSQHQHAGGMETMSHSPVSPSVYQSMNRPGGAVQPPPPPPSSYDRRPSFKDEVSDFASLLRPAIVNHQPPGTAANARRSHVALEHHVFGCRQRAPAQTPVAGSRQRRSISTIETSAQPALRQARGHGISGTD